MEGAEIVQILDWLAECRGQWGQEAVIVSEADYKKIGQLIPVEMMHQVGVGRSRVAGVELMAATQLTIGCILKANYLHRGMSERVEVRHAVVGADSNLGLITAQTTEPPPPGFELLAWTLDDVQPDYQFQNLNIRDEPWRTETKETTGWPPKATCPFCGDEISPISTLPKGEFYRCKCDPYREWGYMPG